MVEGRLVLAGDWQPLLRQDLQRFAREAGFRAVYLAGNRSATTPELERLLELSPILPDGVGRREFSGYTESVRGEQQAEQVDTDWTRLCDLYTEGISTRRGRRRDKTLPDTYREFPLRRYNDLEARRRLPEPPYQFVRFNFKSLDATLDWLRDDESPGRRLRVPGFTYPTYTSFEKFVEYHKQTHLRQIVDRLLMVE